VDCELVSSKMAALGSGVKIEDHGTEGVALNPGAGEGGKEGMVGGFFCGFGCGGVELQASRVGAMRVGKEHVEGRVGQVGVGSGESLLSLQACCVGCGSRVLVAHAGVQGGE